MENSEANSIPSAHNNEENPNCMLWPCQDADFKCQISKSEKIIHDVDRKQTELLKALKRKKIDELGLAFTSLQSALESDWYLIMHGNNQLLEQILDKISFRNKIYQGRAIRSFLSEDDEEKEEAQVNFKNLDFKLRHGNGNKSMAAEKRFLKEIKRKNSSNSNDFLESINKEISLWRYGYDNIDAKTRSQKMKELEFKRDIAITNATVKGQSWWKFLGSKEEIQERINYKEYRVEQITKKRLKNRSHIKSLINRLKTVEKYVVSLESQMEQAKCRKEEAYKRICLLVKHHEDKECCCFGHLSALNNVTEVAKRIFDPLEEYTNLKPELEYRTDQIIEMIACRCRMSSKLERVAPSMIIVRDVFYGKNVKKLVLLEVPVRRWIDLSK
ncbi:uncharacterized protein LOC126657325 [Mercurialis annua]|uniref:uncharacterized protein LOC126657325 n=1 Tax=Mercurialis annua TaxID=3986 RepID=UPI0021607B87|nr:uncharacterized protein LOC126657325 [Mercurialis annua]